MTSPFNPLADALAYAKTGWPVFPLKPKGKKPITKSGFKDATTDPEQVRRWWQENPAANIGIPTGAMIFDVLDIDGPEGEVSLEELEAKTGILPTGPQVRTSRGRHILSTGGSLKKNSAGKIALGLDTRSDGGYVVAPGSQHENGTMYEWIDGAEPIPNSPLHLVQELSEGDGTAPAGRHGEGQEIPQGGRHVTLKDIAGKDVEGPVRRRP